MKFSKANLSFVAALVVLVLSLFQVRQHGSDNTVSFWQSFLQSGKVLGSKDVAGFDYVTVTRVVDGDTIQISTGEVVRYIGIDTPETKHPQKGQECFGTQAADYNEQLVLGKSVRLENDVSDRDRYGRLLRYVWVEDVLINEKLVHEGYAVASTYPPDVKYQERFFDAEAVARAQTRGLWGSCERAKAVVKHSNEIQTIEQTLQPSDGNIECLIKGNISDNGMLYHTPECASYSSTKIDVSKGEKWFCSEAEAVLAGWKKVGNC